jgi:hypothetical protein
LVRVTGQFEVVAYRATIGCNWFLNMGWPGQAITFDGDIVDSAGNPVAGVEVSINEKDLFGRLVPIKKSNGEPVIGFTDAQGHYSLTDDDGWPDGGTKVVWAHAYDGIDVVSPSLTLTVIALPWWWPIPAVIMGGGVIVVGGYLLYEEVKRRELMELLTAGLAARR